MVGFPEGIAHSSVSERVILSFRDRQLSGSVSRTFQQDAIPEPGCEIKTVAATLIKEACGFGGKLKITRSMPHFPGAPAWRRTGAPAHGRRASWSLVEAGVAGSTLATGTP